MTNRFWTNAGRRGRRLTMLIGLAAALLLPGCAWVDSYRGEGFVGEDATWGAAFRPQGGTGERYFFTEKSRQIERSLGL